MKKILFIFALCAFSIYSYANSISVKPYTHYMNKLITLAKKNPKAPFAAMIIDKNTGEILSTGLNNSSKNPTLHGEIDAINNCVKEHPNIKWSGTILMTTAESCPMCESAIIWAGIPTVVYGTSIKYLESQGWNQINISSQEVANRSPFYHGKIIGGILSSKTDKLFARKVKHI